MNLILSEEEKKELKRRLAESAPYFDEEEIYTGCTVQVLTNSKTGEVSVGWVRPDGEVVEII